MRFADQTVRIAIIAAFATLLILCWTRTVHWDEFFFLSRIYSFNDGRLDRALQTFYVHGFTWLTAMPGNEIDRIVAARIVMLGFVGVTVMSLQRIAAHFTNTSAANVAVLAFLSSGYLLPHGASFRADPMAAAFLTTSIAILLTTRMKLFQVLAAAVLSALALLITVKSTLYSPAYLAVLLWRLRDRGVLLRILLAGFLTLIIAFALYSWHANEITAAAGKDTITLTKGAATTVFQEDRWFPRADYIGTWAILSLGPLVLALIGLFAEKNRQVAVLLIALSAPLLSVVIYRNAYPYFFPFAVPLVMVAVAFGAQKLRNSSWKVVLIAIMLLSGAWQIDHSFKERGQTQRAVIAEVHRLFTDPVPYIDASKMIGSFPNYGPFLSTWGLNSLRATGRPAFGPLIAAHEPPLLIANKRPLNQTMAGTTDEAFLPADNAALRDTYVNYNGAIWLAGREVTLTQSPQAVTVPFVGLYRVVTTVPIEIDGQVIVDGDTLSLNGTVALDGPSGTQVKLIWDTSVPPLETSLPTKDMNSKFFSFW